MRSTQIQLRHMAHSPALTQRIQELSQKLEEKNSRVMRCRVAVEAETHRARKGGSYEVRVDVAVAGAPDCVADRRHDADVYVALRDAFAAVEKQLEPLHA
jgi:ribosome-associated translation inhibitor RaiA